MQCSQQLQLVSGREQSVRYFELVDEILLLVCQELHGLPAVYDQLLNLIFAG